VSMLILLLTAISCNCIDCKYSVFIVCSVPLIVCVVLLFCVMCINCVLCLIVVPIPPSKNPFAIKINK
jgi:hypothetical protein